MDLIHPWRQIDNYVIVIIGSVCGNSSAVEHRLAKAGVASSNLVSRSNFIWRHSQAVRQRSAKPLFPSSILGAASTIVTHAGVAEQADATDLKSVGWKQPYRFDSGPRHQFSFYIAGWSSLVARRAHNPKVVGSNPAPATIRIIERLFFFYC